MPWLLLLLGGWWLALTVNALHPLRGRYLLLPSWLASWLIIELAGHQLVLQIVVTALLVSLGAATGWPGWLGLGLAVASCAGLASIIWRSRRSATAVQECLADIAGDEPPPRVPWREVLVPIFLSRRRGVERIRDVEYARVAGRRLLLDIYRPRSPGAPRPAVLQIHGGAWVMGDKREQGIPLLTHLADNGWIGFNVNYRLSPGATFPDHLVDVKRALAWVREHSGELGVDPGFVAVTGGSAGGHLTALMALTQGLVEYQPGFEEADTSVQAAVPFYGVYDLADRLGVHAEELFSRLLEPHVLKAYRRDEPERFREASPLEQVHPGAPPFLVIHGDTDTLVPVEDARAFVDRLRSASGERVFYLELEGAQHAFDVFSSVRTARVIEGIERFLAWAVARARSREGVRRVDWRPGRQENGAGP